MLTMWRVLATVLVLYVCLTDVNPARILGVFPMPSVSHQAVMRALTTELLKKGHEVVVITPTPEYKDKNSPVNLTEIDVSDAFKHIMGIIKGKKLKRGVIMDADTIMTPNHNSSESNRIHGVIHCLLNFTNVNQLIEDKNQKFDVVIIEGLFSAALIFGKIFNAPVILYTSSYGTATNYETIGALSRHPLAYPFNIFRSKLRNLSFFDKFEQLYLEYKLWRFDQENEELDNKFLKSRFGADAPSIAELKKNVELLLVNVHPIFDGNRPVPPGTVYLGALHLQDPKPLPEDLKSYLDSSTRGIVYVSLGTSVSPSQMDKDLLDAFFDAFKRLPYDILMKFDVDNLDGIPKNVKIQKWFPQRDLLCHPNIKLFITQGGLQSTDEAIDAEVPLVGIPMLADQWYNTNKYVELGIGVDVDTYTMVADDLVKAVNTVVNDPSYKENMKKLKAFMRDQPERALDRAVWWTEHVLRHRGSRYLLGADAQMSWTEYLMLDVIITLAVIFYIVVAITIIVFSKILRLIFRRKSNVKAKQS